ncbi:Pentatricopeptide repeat-containing protein [Melia azedarach]|uniref:Pentatricopeptide repeat-containing protein n=1 Tax=Melia azedarach TaxID=155640 RepID=A0ACC1X4V4_MELAZ|nr:Pentatricopeptide repeat-containing protein [Melia azedarach]
MKLAIPITRHFSASTTTQKLKRVSKNAVSINSIKELHAHLIRTDLHTDPSSISHVIKSYALSPSYLQKAHLAFNQLERPTLLIVNHMIHGLSQSDQPKKAIDMYNHMYQQGLSGDNLTFIFVIKACARVRDVYQGQKAHVHTLKLGFESYLFVSNALIHMYAACGDLGLARKLFDVMSVRDLVSWNSLICGYSQCNRFEEVLCLFNSMQEDNIKADAVTMVKVILACIYLGNWAIADSVIRYIEEKDIEIDVYLGNTLIDMYGRRGLVDLAREVFNQMCDKNVISWNAMIMGYAKATHLIEARQLLDEMPRRDVISWTSLITGYSRANQFAEALNLFQEMMLSKVKPDEITVASVLSACAHLGSLDMGEAIHDYIQRIGTKMDIYVGNSLVDMYCKCGAVEKALMVFHEMEKKDSVSWTSIISGLAVNGFADYALELFKQMLREDVRPTHGTFVGILLACTHAGVIDEGLQYFENMEKVYGLTPEMKHYGCVVDLLSRSGHLEKAYEFMVTMPMAPDVVVWRILLNALLMQVRIDGMMLKELEN